MRHGVIVLTLSSNRQAYVKKSVVLDHKMNFKSNNRKKEVCRYLIQRI